MTENTNYEDNLFFLSQIIGQTENACKLNLDQSLFQCKLIDDIIFVDHTMQHIFKNLTENSFLINRNQYLHSLMKKKKRFTDLLNEFLSDAQRYGGDGATRSTLQRSLEIHISDIQDIREILSLSNKNDEEKDIISTDELNFLMAPGLLDSDDDE